MTKILIADDHPVVRRFVRAALEKQGWEVCGEASTGREAVDLTAAHQPEIVVLDLSMPEMDGLDAARKIRDNFPHTKMIVLTMHDVPDLMLEALSRGVRACILKSDLQQLI